MRQVYQLHNQYLSIKVQVAVLIRINFTEVSKTLYLQVPDAEELRKKRLAYLDKLENKDADLYVPVENGEKLPSGKWGWNNNVHYLKFHKI